MQKLSRRRRLCVSLDAERSRRVDGFDSPQEEYRGRVVICTIRGFLPQGPRDPPHHLERRDGRIGRDICPPASLGNGKVRPKRALIESPLPGTVVSRRENVSVLVETKRTNFVHYPADTVSQSYSLHLTPPIGRRYDCRCREWAEAGRKVCMRASEPCAPARCARGDN